MIVGNVNWVCFDCRKSVKALPHGGGPRCPTAHKVMHEIGMHTPAPKRNDVKGWKKMHDDFFDNINRNRLLTSLGGGFDAYHKMREVEKLRGKRFCSGLVAELADFSVSGQVVKMANTTGLSPVALRGLWVRLPPWPLVGSACPPGPGGPKNGGLGSASGYGQKHMATSVPLADVAQWAERGLGMTEVVCSNHTVGFPPV